MEMMAVGSIFSLLWMMIAFAVWVTMVVCVVIMTISLTKIASTLDKIEKKFGEQQCETRKSELEKLKQE
jgi:hypothetical protein